jgi:small conductance mechanosensitive channel
MYSSWLQAIADILGVAVEEVNAVLLQKSGRLILIWIGAFIMFRVVKLLSRRILKAVDDGDDAAMTYAEKRGHTVAGLITKVGRVLIIALAMLLTLAEFINIGPLRAGAGIFGLAVSFGAQSLVKDVIAGFFILVENQLVVGDNVEVLGKAGVVEDVSLRVVRVRDLNGTLHTIPCGSIDVVSNRTAGWARAMIDVDVGYATDVDRALVVFKEVAEAMAESGDWKHRIDGPPEIFGVQQLAESGVTIRTGMRTEPGHQWAVAREFRRRIKTRLDAEGIEIPFPQRTLHVKYLGDPTLTAPADE